MDTVRDKILNALTLFYQKIKSIFIQTTNVVNNCASTSTTYPLSAAQGTSLQGQIDDINSTLDNISIGANKVTITRKTGTINVNGSALVDLGSGHGSASAGFIIGANAYGSSNAAIVPACAIQNQRHLRIFLEPYTSATITVKYEYFILKLS